MELTIYQANRREVEFDVDHAAFSAAFEELLGRTDVSAFADAARLTAEAARERLASFVGPLDFSYLRSAVRGHEAVWRASNRRRRTFAGRQSPAIARRNSRPRILHLQGTAVTMTDVYAPNDLLRAEPEVLRRSPEK